MINFIQGAAPCMHVCVYANNFLLFRSNLPDCRGTGHVLTNPTLEVGKEVPKHSQYGLMLGFPSTYVQVKDRSGSAAPRLGSMRISDTPSPKHKNPPGIHDNDRNHYWSGYQSIQWRPWNKVAFRCTNYRSARRKNHRISLGKSRKPHQTIIDRAECC